MFLPLKHLLTSRLAEHGILKGAVVAQVVGETKRFIKERWGESALDMIRDLYLKHDTLQIKTSSSAISQEIKLVESELEEVLNKKFPGKVKRLRIFS
ncbi:MAG: hypothetical protein ABIJ81_03910 [Patescibacteria group bacterium]